jgi:hypothetical protein
MRVGIGCGEEICRQGDTNGESKNYFVLKNECNWKNN